MSLERIESLLSLLERFITIGLVPVALAVFFGAVGDLIDGIVSIVKDLHEARAERHKLINVFSIVSSSLKIVASIIIPVVIIFMAITSQSGLDKYSWEALSEISQEISAARSEEDAIRIAKEKGLVDKNGRLDGTQVKRVKLKDGTETSVQLIGIYHDETSGDGGKAGLTFAFTEAIAEHAMNNGESTNRGGWADSDMRRWLGEEVEEWLPDDLRGEIKTVTKMTNYINPEDGANQVRATDERLWLLSVSECVGDPRDCGVWTGELDYLNDIANAEGVQYKLFRDASINPKRNHGLLLREYAGGQSSSGNVSGVACQWWLRSPSAATSDSFASEFAGDEPDGAAEAVAPLGVVPCFCI